MNKKGMTLVELIAVIAILAILSIITVPSITGIRNNMLEKSLTSKIESIKTAALEYADDNINRVPSDICITSDFETVYNNENYTGEKVSSCEPNLDCLMVKVGSLIEKGYLTGDDNSKEIINNPINGNSLNNEMVCVRFDSKNAISRKLEAYVLQENRLYEDE